jgi:hypothetical protein
MVWTLAAIVVVAVFVVGVTWLVRRLHGGTIPRM